MQENAEAAVLTAFVADSLALGAHWIYNTDKIDREFGRVEHLVAPLPQSFHAGREKGEFTHYGDQSRVLLQSLAQTHDFDLEDFSQRWRRLFDDYDGYFDKATKETLKNFADGKSPEQAGSGSDDLAGAVRIAPLVYRYRDDEQSLLRAVKAQTAMTHNHPDVIAAAEFLARTALAVLFGESPQAAMRRFAQGQDRVQNYVSKGLESTAVSTRQAIADFGQVCETPMALPGVVHLIGKYERDLPQALIENVMAGGDSAARGMAVGLILGACHGKNAIPDQWLSEMKATGTIQKLLQAIEAEAS